MRPAGATSLGGFFEPFAAIALRVAERGCPLAPDRRVALIAGQKVLTGSYDTLQVYDLQSAEEIGDPLKWVTRGCTGTRASTHLLTTRCFGNSAWIDLDSREVTRFPGIRPGCSVNNNLYPANGVMNIPNLTGGCA